MSALVSPPLSNASRNHLVVKPDSGRVGVALSLTENTTRTTSGENKNATKNR